MPAGGTGSGLEQATKITLAKTRPQKMAHFILRPSLASAWEESGRLTEFCRIGLSAYRSTCGPSNGANKLRPKNPSSIPLTDSSRPNR